ncbi:SusE domain-containing protein, partial [Flavobacterium sp. J27]|uniref:SusE domain-containing protein n=1 Tax=Flavobacterium sp. J27 TaxID=2060419 RepID=UPI00197A8440
MKKILKISALVFLLGINFSCENDEQVTVQADQNPQLVSPVDGSSYELNPANPNNEATTLVWNHAKYSVQTEVNYEVQVALSGSDFSTFEVGGNTTSRFMTWTVETLNGLMMNLGAIPYSPTDIDIRLKASLGSNASLVSYSNVITLTVTPYTTDLPRLAVAGNHQG